MIVTLSKIVGVSLAFCIVASGAVRADCESDLIKLEQAFKAPGLSPDGKAALEAAKTKSVAALKKDDDATCHAAVTEGFIRAGIPVAAPAAPAAKDSGASLGDLTPYRAIAADTLRIVKTGDLAAATKRIKDLETAWDAAQAKLKPMNTSKWTIIDKSIDAALKQLRATTPVAASSADALQNLLALMDTIKKA